MFKMPLMIGGPAKDPRRRKSRSLQRRWKGTQEAGLQTGQAHAQIMLIIDQQELQDRNIRII